MKSQYTICFFLLLLSLSCKWCRDTDSYTINSSDVDTKAEMQQDSSETKIKKLTKEMPLLNDLEELEDTLFVNLKNYSKDFAYDLKYATNDNFLKTAVYECAECYTRAVTARALIAANQDFIKKGYRIKFFDCYRPNSVQWQMWKLVPNPQYVADPKKGSIHNKGGAVDITLVDLDGNELAMGTDFDFFGKKAHHDFTSLPEEVLKNRTLLRETMEKHGFWSIRTEWWHYNLNAASNYTVADFKWSCTTDN
ncbi:M15 family metallopeptidase [Flavobacteriaceae bacterium M23B6Z8]